MNFFLNIGFTIGCVDLTLFLKKINNDLLVVQIYVDDIIFGVINEYLRQEFSKQMQNQFEMSMVRELSFFHRLQIQ